MRLKTAGFALGLVVAVGLGAPMGIALAEDAKPFPVSVDNFKRAENDLILR